MVATDIIADTYITESLLFTTSPLPASNHASHHYLLIAVPA